MTMKLASPSAQHALAAAKNSGRAFSSRALGLPPGRRSVRAGVLRFQLLDVVRSPAPDGQLEDARGQ